MGLDQKSGREKIFALYAFFFAVTALYHIAAMIRDGYTDRHLLFVGINVLSASLTWFRPRSWYPAYLGALNVQQLYSHGGDLFEVARREHAVDWNSLLVVTALPALLALAVWSERKQNRHG